MLCSAGLRKLLIAYIGTGHSPVLRQQRVLKHLPHQNAIRAETDLGHALRVTLRFSGAVRSREMRMVWAACWGAHIPQHACTCRPWS